MIPRRAFLLALTATLLLGGCGQAVPAERAAYLGDWRSDGGRWNGQGDGMSLRIEPEGRIDYLRREGRGHTKISAPIQRFVGDDFEGGGCCSGPRRSRSSRLRVRKGRAGP